MERLGDRLKKLRIQKQDKIKDLAGKIGISIQAWTDYEKNRIMPQLEKLMAIASYFKVSLDYLVYGDELNFEPPTITRYYDGYLCCLIELLSNNLLEIETKDMISPLVYFKSDDEIIKIFTVEYLRALTSNKTLLNKNEMKEIYKLIANRYNSIETKK